MKNLLIVLALGFSCMFGVLENGNAGDRSRAPLRSPVNDRETDPLILAKLEEFKDLKFGLFIHWGPCAQWGAQIAWAISKNADWARPDDFKPWVERGKDYDRFTRDFIALNKTFNPQGFDPEKWARAAKYAGMKYMVFVTKCHDGFCMFDTRQTTYSSTDPSCAFHTSPRANITRQVLDAFRKEGIRTGVYFSKPDWHSPDYEDPTLPAQRDFSPNYDVRTHPEKWQRFLRFAKAQVGELTSNYGSLDILWLDGGAFNVDAAFAKMARRNQPSMLIVDRGAGGRFENYRTPEQQIPDKPLPYAWETCMTMGDYWAYNPHDYYKPARELIHLLVQIVCKGGNLLLDIGPDANGQFPPAALERLQELGDWMKFNGDAIYGTRPVAPYREGQVCFTRKGEAVYLIWLAKDGQTRPPRQVVVSSIQPAAGAQVTQVGTNLPLQWKKKDKGCVVYIDDRYSNPLRGQFPYCRHAWAIKISKAVVQPESELPHSDKK